jgi:hypothetical protein
MDCAPLSTRYNQSAGSGKLSKNSMKLGSWSHAARQRQSFVMNTILGVDHSEIVRGCIYTKKIFLLRQGYRGRHTVNMRNIAGQTYYTYLLLWKWKAAWKHMSWNVRRLFLFAMSTCKGRFSWLLPSVGRGDPHMMSAKTTTRGCISSFNCYHAALESQNALEVS